MIKRIFTLFAALVGLTGSAMADDNIEALGNATFSIPEGWTKIGGTDGRLTFAAPDGQQQLTVSLMRFGPAPSFADFGRICAHRYEAEKNGVAHLSLTPENPVPQEESDKFTMSFSGKEEASGRIFSGLLSLKNKELITVYLEGIEVDAATNRKVFAEIVTSLKQ